MHNIAAAARAGLPAIRRSLPPLNDLPLRFDVFVRPAAGSPIGSGDEAHKIEALFRGILEEYSARLHAFAAAVGGPEGAEFHVSVRALAGSATAEDAATYEHVFGLIIDRLIGLSFGEVTLVVRAGKPQSVVRAVSDLIG